MTLHSSSPNSRPFCPPAAASSASTLASPLFRVLRVRILPPPARNSFRSSLLGSCKIGGEPTSEGSLRSNPPTDCGFSCIGLHPLGSGHWTRSQWAGRHFSARQWVPGCRGSWNRRGVRRRSKRWTGSAVLVFRWLWMKTTWATNHARPVPVFMDFGRDQVDHGRALRRRVAPSISMIPRCCSCSSPYLLIRRINRCEKGAVPRSPGTTASRSPLRIILTTPILWFKAGLVSKVQVPRQKKHANQQIRHNFYGGVDRRDRQPRQFEEQLETFRRISLSRLIIDIRS